MSSSKPGCTTCHKTGESVCPPTRGASSVGSWLVGAVMGSIVTWWWLAA